MAPAAPPPRDISACQREARVTSDPAAPFEQRSTAVLIVDHLRTDRWKKTFAKKRPKGKTNGHVRIQTTIRRRQQRAVAGAAGSRRTLADVLINRAAHVPAFACAIEEEMHMTTNVKITMAAIGGLVLGAGLSGGIDIAPGALHAQGTTPYYTVAEINVKDEAGYEKSGVEKVRDAIKASGGKVVAGGYNKAQGYIGAPPPNRFLIVMYPNKEAQSKVWTGTIKPWIDAEGTKYATFREVGAEAIEPK
jgi:uncharacterized protein (DUF1330 family)